jgi:hypothetical protein
MLINTSAGNEFPVMNKSSVVTGVVESFVPSITGALAECGVPDNAVEIMENDGDELAAGSRTVAEE